VAIVVQKYGGSSVANAERIQRVAGRVVECARKGKHVVVVVSARGDTTDDLISLAREITNEPPKREMDMLLATGEQISIALLAMAIDKLGHPVISLTGPQAGISTDAVHTKARIQDINTRRIRDELAGGKIVIVAGFQGATTEGEITTLGRGGSDTTAVALAAALDAEVCEIYTDVDGVYTTDPRIEPQACKLDSISYDEMLELASLGAQVLHPRSVEYGKQYGVPIHVRSSFNHNRGTMVQEVDKMEKVMMVSGIAYDLNVAKIALYDVPDKPGIAFQLFEQLAKESINVDMIIQSSMRDERNDISFTVGKDDLNRAVAVVQKVREEIGGTGISYDEKVAKVSIVGAGMVSNPGVAASMFGALAQEGINIQMISTSEIKVSCIISSSQVQQAVRALHKTFDLAAVPNVQQRIG